MKLQRTVSVVIFTSIVWPTRRNVIPIYLLSRKTWLFLLGTKFVSQANRLSKIVYQPISIIWIFLNLKYTSLDLRYRQVTNGGIGSGSYFLYFTQTKLMKVFIAVL